MRKLNELFSKIVKKTVSKSLEKDANSTTCGVIYQPKAPAKLNEYKKINKEWLVNYQQNSCIN